MPNEVVFAQEALVCDPTRCHTDESKLIKGHSAVRARDRSVAQPIERGYTRAGKV